MRNGISLLVLALTLFCGCKNIDYSQGSGFTLENPDSAAIDNLEVIGKVWGYVKYHHPAFADSTVNADHGLFGILPKAAEASTPKRNKILYDWVISLGDFESVPEKYEAMLDTLDYESYYDDSWVNEKYLGQDLYGLLNRLKYADRQDNYYVTRNYLFWQNYKWAEVRKSEYPADMYIDHGYRLLSLFKLWNIFEYYSPYRNMTDKDWGGLLREYIPEILRSDHDHYRNIMAHLIADENDGHAVNDISYLTGYRRMPIDVKFADNILLVTDVFEKDGNSLQRGDEILEIDGIEVWKLRGKYSRYISHSNKNAYLGYLRDRIISSDKNEVRVSFQREGQKMECMVKTIPFSRLHEYRINKGPQGLSYYYIDRSIAYIHAGELDAANDQNFNSFLAGAKTLIIDMRAVRSNFGDVIQKFLISEPVHGIVFAIPLNELPGYYYYYKLYWNYENPGAYKGNIIVLVDETTQSSGETFTMVMQALPHTVTVGSHSAGANGDVVPIDLPENIYTYISGLGVYYPDRTTNQRKGVKIDHYVSPTAEGIKAGRDEIMEKAIEIAKNQNTAK